MTLEPPAHLSEAARAHLADPPESVAGMDATDTEVVEKLRAELHPIWAEGNQELPQPWHARDAEIAGVPVVWFAGSEADFDSRNIMIHLHGGAYHLGSPTTNAVIPVPIAQRTGLPVLSIDYRLAPEHRCPAAIDDVVAVLAALATERTFVAMFGESAGGGLAVAAAVALQDAGIQVPGRLGLLSPWVDLTCSGDTYQTLAHVDPDFPNVADPPNWAAAYAGTDTANPQASPLFADLAGLPPTLIQVGGREILLSDSCRLHAAMTAVGVACTLDIWDGLWHVWQMYGHLPEAQQAFDELATFLTGDDQ